VAVLLFMGPMRTAWARSRRDGPHLAGSMNSSTATGPKAPEGTGAAYFSMPSRSCSASMTRLRTAASDRSFASGIVSAVSLRRA